MLGSIILDNEKHPTFQILQKLCQQIRLLSDARKVYDVKIYEPE